MLDPDSDAEKRQAIDLKLERPAGQKIAATGQPTNGFLKRVRIGGTEAKSIPACGFILLNR